MGFTAAKAAKNQTNHSLSCSKSLFFYGMEHVLCPWKTAIMSPASHGNVKCMEFQILAIKRPCISQNVTFANRLFTFLSFNSDSWNNSSTDKMPLKKVIKRRAAPWLRGGEAVTFHISCSISKAAPLKTPGVIFQPEPICAKEGGVPVRAVTAAVVHADGRGPLLQRQARLTRGELGQK